MSHTTTATAILDNTVRLNNEGTSLLVAGRNACEASQCFQQALHGLMALLDQDDCAQTPNPNAGTTIEGEPSIKLATGLCHSSQAVPLDHAHHSGMDSYSLPLVYTHNHAILLSREGLLSLLCTCPRGVVRFVMVSLLWNAALASHQWGQAYGESDQKRATTLFGKSLQLYARVVRFATSLHGEWANRPDSFAFLALAAQNNLSCILLQRGFRQQAMEAQGNLTQLCRAQTSCLTKAEKQIAMEFSLNTTILYTTGFLSRLPAQAA